MQKEREWRCFHLFSSSSPFYGRRIHPSSSPPDTTRAEANNSGFFFSILVVAPDDLYFSIPSKKEFSSTVLPRPRSTYKLTTSQLLYRPNSIWASFSQKGGIEMKKKKLSRLLLFYFYFIFFDFFLVPFVCRRWIIHWKPPAGLMSRYPLVGWASNQTHTTFQYIQGGLKGTKLFSFSLSLSVCVCVCWLYYVISKTFNCLLTCSSLLTENNIKETVR